MYVVIVLYVHTYRVGSVLCEVDINTYIHPSIHSHILCRLLIRANYTLLHVQSYITGPPKQCLFSRNASSLLRSDFQSSLFILRSSTFKLQPLTSQSQQIYWDARRMLTELGKSLGPIRGIMIDVEESSFGPRFALVILSSA